MDKNELNQIYSDLHSSPEVKSAVDRLKARGEDVKGDINSRVDTYISRLEEIFDVDDEKKLERREDIVKNWLYNKYVIKEDNIPESYFNLQKKLIRERGYGDVEIDDNTKNELSQVLIQDQKDSLDEWFEYIKTEQLPSWFKYYVLRSSLKLAEYDKGTGEYPKRSRGTVKKFPEVDREALSYLYEALNSKYGKSGGEVEGEIDSGVQRLLDRETNFAKLYAYIIENVKGISDSEKEITEGKWVKYNQGDNPDKLVSSLRGKGTGWCTAGESTAKTQLETGDFYVYYTNNSSGNPVNPRVAIRMEGGVVAEVRGIMGKKQELEPKMMDIARNMYHQLPGGEKFEKKDNDMRYLTEIERKVSSGEELSVEELRFLYEIDSEIEGFGYGEDPRIRKLRGMRNMKKDCCLIFNCSEDQIASNMSEINNNTVVLLGDFIGKEINYVPKNLLYISGDADFRDSQITDLGNLTSIGLYADFRGSQIRDLGNLTSIGLYADFRGSQIRDLGNLTSIGGGADFGDSQITDLGNLTSIGGDASFRGSQITDLGNLTSIGMCADFRDSQITDLGNLTSIGLNAYFENSQITDLGNLTSIGRDADFGDSQITDLGNLTSIGRDADFGNSQITDLGNLTSIGRNADFENSQITDLGNLTSIGGSVDFRGSQITDLGNLTSIGMDAYFGDSQIRDLGNLTSIGGSADFRDSQITDLGDLEYIGRTVYYDEHNELIKKLLRKKKFIT